MKLSFFEKCKSITFSILTIAFFFNNVQAQETALGYQTPPQEMVDIIENTVNRSVILSGRANFLAILEEPGYPSIAEVSQPILRLAGIRINPKNFENSRKSYFSSLKIKNIHHGDEFAFSGIPKGSKLKNISFSPDEEKVAFSISTENQVQLWVGDLQTRIARRLDNVILNDVYGSLYQWSADGESILAKCVASTSDVPKFSEIPFGPNVQESLGKSSPSVTYQDLLKNKKDEALFDYYLTVQLKTVYLNGQSVNYSLPGIYKDFEFSPDGTLVMTSIIKKPYSYLVPISYFPYRVEIRDKYGKIVQEAANVPLADNLPSGFDAVVKGPREFGWRNDKPKTYFWVEAQDEGNPNNRVTVRDIIYTKEADDDKAIPKPLAKCYLRFNYIDWGDDEIAIINERWWKTRGERRVYIKPGSSSYRVNLWDRYYEDSYSDPGKFVTIKNKYNRDVLLLDYNMAVRAWDHSNMDIFSISEGASPKGNRPFLLKFNVKSKLTDTLFRSRAPFYEKPLYYDDRENLIISRESVAEPTNYVHIDLKKRREEKLTNFKNPYPKLFGIIKQQINYKRSDNLNLTATLYLPKGYVNSKGRLPVLMWAYPREFKTIAAAAQVKGSPYQFSKISWASPIFWVTQGYAVMDNVDMPIVGESNDEPNDTFVEQLKMNADAAINKIFMMGIGDPKRIAIGGHSYGAFMTANLLAHTNFFAAGIARSGAYNRTLTPFGFQAEERTYWQAPEVYNKMSPFSYADKVNSPLLLIHGEADDNSGTFPIQSERFYNALKGFGAITRLVYLPAEAHSYKAKESILHMLWEMNNWLDKYVKNKQ